MHNKSIVYLIQGDLIFREVHSIDLSTHFHVHHPYLLPLRSPHSRDCGAILAEIVSAMSVRSLPPEKVAQNAVICKKTMEFGLDGAINKWLGRYHQKREREQTDDRISVEASTDYRDVKQAKLH